MSDLVEFKAVGIKGSPRKFQENQGKVFQVPDVADFFNCMEPCNEFSVMLLVTVSLQHWPKGQEIGRSIFCASLAVKRSKPLVGDP